MKHPRDIVLLHGALGSSHDLEPLAKALGSAGFKCHTLTFSGHGSTPFAAHFGVPRFVSELHNLLGEKNLQRAPVFGYSMGGYVALYNAFVNNMHSGRIITLGTKLHWTAAGLEKEKTFLNPEAILQKSPAYAKALQQSHGQHWETLLAKTAAMMDEIVARQFLNPEVFEQIRNKTLLGRAENDKMVSLAETLGAMQALPHAQHYLIEGSHPLGTIQAEELARVIFDFTAGN